MKHKVTCMDCDKTERIEVEKGKKIMCGWAYYGKLDVNVCRTNKYFYKAPEGVDFCDFEKHVRVKNSCYNPSVKRKYVEMWVCPACLEKEGD